jgi:hypothetical protein
VAKKRNMYANRCCCFGRERCDIEVEMIIKNEDLTIQIQRMWNVKTSVIPVITGATGTVSK